MSLKKTDTENDSLLNLYDLLEIIAQNIRIVLAVPSATCIFAIIYTSFFYEPIYVASAKIMSSSSNSNISQTLGLASQFGFSMPNINKNQEWVYPEVIKSRTLARSLLNRQFDTQKYGKRIKLVKIITGKETINLSAIDMLSSMISVKMDRGKSYYSLKVATFEPKFAANLVQAVIDELENYQKEYDSAKLRDTRLFIESRILEVGTELNQAEEELKDFRDRNRRIDDSPSLLLEQQRLSREATVLTGVYTTLKQQLEQTKMDELRESSYVIVLDKPEPPLFRSKPNKTKSVMLAGVSGLTIGLSFAFMNYFFRNISLTAQSKLKRILKTFKEKLFMSNNNA